MDVCDFLETSSCVAVFDFVAGDCPVMMFP